MKKLSIFVAALLCASIASADNTYLDRTGWTWSASSIYPGQSDDIIGLEGAYDGDSSTCWHTNWTADDSSPERKNPHWLMIDRGSDTTAFYGISYLGRQSNNMSQCCTSFMIYLSDSDLSSTPATSTDDIIAALGEPDYQGTWEASYNELTYNFTTASTARYILFVNVSSYNSSSAACAEFNLLAKKDTSGLTTYNAVKITPSDGSTPHRIAIDGTNLTIAMNGSAVQLSNSEITVEYLMEEFSYMEFENYEFENGLYDGTKRDVNEVVPLDPFDLVVTPSESTIESLTEITIAAAAGALPNVNNACTSSLTITFDSEIVYEATVSKMADKAVDNQYVIDDVSATVDGTYTLSIPAEFFVDSDGAYSNALTMNWVVDSTLGGESSINNVTDNVATIALSRTGNELVVSGLGHVSTVSLIAMNGITVASSTVNAHGVANLSLNSLPKGVYILVAGSTTLKITI